MKCDKCECGLPGNGDHVSCSVCEKKYHYDCSVREAKWRNMAVHLRNKWTCSVCKGTSSLTRVNSDSSSLGDVMPGTEEEPTTRALLLSMNARLNVLDEVKASVDSMSASVSFLSDKYDELLSEIKGYKKVNDEIKSEVQKLKGECAKKGEELTVLTRRFNSLEQYGRGLNLEVHGLAQVRPDENPEEIVSSLAKAINVPYNPWEVQAAHRLPSRNNRPPAFLIQFVSKAVKQQWLLTGRRMKIYSKEVVSAGEGRVFFNENLTPFYSKLFYEARKLAQEKHYESVWIMNGSIRMKKKRDDRKSFIISDYEDLSKLVG